MNKTLTTSEFINQSYNLATELQNLGSKPGVIIGIISENRLEFLPVLLATIMTGAALTCFNPAYSIGEAITSTYAFVTLRVNGV